MPTKTSSNRYYLKETVFDAALDRIRWVFDEFPNVVVSFSGGKDSTTLLNLALQVAREKNRLPLKVAFLDQEAEWQCVIDYIRTVSQNPDVQMLWFQIPVRLFNSASMDEQSNWLNCWDPAEKNNWMREQEPDSIKVNRYGTDRFKDLFTAISKTEFGDQKTAWLAGVRCEESMARFTGLTTQPTYKHATWGIVLSKPHQHYTLYPLYDWSWRDIWKAIHSNGWNYCKIYDEQFRLGYTVKNMRVSNLHHETSFEHLFFLQEIENETWEKLCKRLPGVNTVGHLKKDAYKVPDKHPPMFSSWQEYRDYLLEKLITVESNRQSFRKLFKRMDSTYRHFPHKEDMYKKQVGAILINDYHSTTLNTWEVNPERASWRQWMNGKTSKYHAINRHIKASIAAGIGRIPTRF